MEQSPSCEAAGFQSVKIFPALHGTGRLIITFKSATMVPYPEPDWSSPVPSLLFLPSPSRSSTWLFYVRFPNKTPYAPLFSPIRSTCHAHLVRLDLFTRVMFGASCQLALFGYPDWGFSVLYLSCKANARVKLAKKVHGPHSSKIFVLFYVLFVLCRSVYCVCVCVCV